MTKKLCLIVPCYNEEEILTTSAQLLEKKLCSLIKLQKISPDSKIMFVDDGSTDRTWFVISRLNKTNPIFTGIKLSKNKGHQNALIAGLLTANLYFDFTISLDADLQDDINAIDEMIDKFNQGYEIVYGVRTNRQTDSFFKKTTANMFYKIMNLLGAKTINNHADFRLMSKKATKALEQFNEVNIFLRGIIPLIGYKTTKVFYERKARSAGLSKYPLKKMLYFAIDGLTSCSTKLINIIFYLGLVSALVSTVILINILHLYPKTTDSTILLSIWSTSTINLIALTIIGIYVSKTYFESKHRPRFFIEETTN